MSEIRCRENKVDPDQVSNITVKLIRESRETECWCSYVERRLSIVLLSWASQFKTSVTSAVKSIAMQ